MGPIGVPEMIAIFVIALLLFGPKKLPELGRTLGKAITEFRRASNELKATFESHLSELDKEGQSLKQTLNSYVDPDPSPYSYDNDYKFGGSGHSQSSGYSETSHSEAYSETSASQPTTASATATQDAPASRDEHETAVPHVAGTVARSTNLPEETGAISHEETHPA
jgi:sec-independent protein translocase protein TatA